MNPVSQFLTYIGETITQFTKTAIFVSLAIVVSLIFGVLQLQLVGSVGNIFDPQSQYVRDFEAFSQTYDSLEREIVIVIENDDILSDVNRNEISNLHLELEFLDDVNGVISIASLRDAPQKTNSMGQLIADDNFANMANNLSTKDYTNTRLRSIV
ncbi:MAG: hypothetical protein COB13_010255 [OCS116 cluster bacterium]|nr:hypothetical protein [OCS116 cluster bacterium]